MSRPLPLRLTATAEDDLAEIWTYLAEEGSEGVATGFVRKLEANFQSLRFQPQLGPMRARLAPGLRVIFEGNYAIYYLHLPDAVVIVRVLNGARGIEALAAKGGFL